MKLYDLFIFAGGFFMGIVFVLALFIYQFLYVDLLSNIASGVTKEKILSIRPEMSSSEVYNILGKPLHHILDSYTSKGDNTINEDTWVYGEPGVFGLFEIYVVFESKRVSHIRVEYDDICVYSCEKNKCPETENKEILDGLDKYGNLQSYYGIHSKYMPDNKKP